MYTDASATGIGAVLMQPDDLGTNRPIAYASRTLNSAEANYSVTYLEGLAIVWALKHFREIILGYNITVFTDHVAITELFRGRGKNFSSRLPRWYLTEQEFNPTFKYLPGRASVVADAMSCNVPVGVVTKQIPVVQNLSPHELINGTFAAKSGMLWSLGMNPICLNYLFLSHSSSCHKKGCYADTYLTSRNLCHNWQSLSHMCLPYCI